MSKADHSSAEFISAAQIQQQYAVSSVIGSIDNTFCHRYRPITLIIVLPPQDNTRTITPPPLCDDGTLKTISLDPGVRTIMMGYSPEGTTAELGERRYDADLPFVQSP